MMTDPANRNVLTKEILDFCGALPIYSTEVYTDVKNGNGTKASKPCSEIIALAGLGTSIAAVKLYA